MSEGEDDVEDGDENKDEDVVVEETCSEWRWSR
jgi:hypothetical protein